MSIPDPPTEPSPFPQRFGAAFYTNRASWPALREAVIAAELAGFDSVWLDDHLLTDEGAWDDDKLESWATLGALAGLTSRVTLGLLVGANTLRNPGLTAKLATTLDHLSDGRAVLGLGAGWFEREHEAFGIKFGSWMGERIDRLGEAVGLIRRLLDGEVVTHAGRFYRLDEAIVRPRPVQAQAADPHRRDGPAQDAPDRRCERGPVERVRDAGGPRPCRAGGCRCHAPHGLRGDRPRPSHDRADPQPRGGDPTVARAGGRRIRVDPAAAFPATGARPCRRRATGRDRQDHPCRRGARLPPPDLDLPRAVRPRDDRSTAGGPCGARATERDATLG